MYGFATTLTTLSFDDAQAMATAALKVEGVGVLSCIDVQRAIQEKLGADGPSYRILGACFPPHAHRSLQAEPDISSVCRRLAGRRRTELEPPLHAT